MAQPAAYTRAFSFTNFQALNPSASLPGSSVDLELNNIKTTTDQIRSNLALIQRDDGGIANASVGLDQLKSEVTVGFQVPTVWATGIAYATSNTVFNGSAFYRCLVAHTSGTFATDLAALKWQLIVDLSAVALVSASQIAVTPSGNLTTNVQTSLSALDAAKAATSHTHPSTAISDSTSAGRAMLVAANVAAQQTLLGLGSLAYLNSIPVTQITAQLAFTNPISPSALIANTNDWSPTGWSTAAVVKFSTSSAINLTGFSATNDGDLKLLENTGLYVVTLLIESSASAAANRITGPSFPTSITIQPGASLPIIYDATAQRWRILAPIALAPQLAIAGGFRNLKCGNSAGNGFTYAGTANTDFRITVDAATLEDANGNAIRVSSVDVTAQTGTTGANGFDGTGSLVSAPLFAWVIYNPTTAMVAALLSRSATAPTMPSGYTFKWRCAGTFTNSSSQLLRTFQANRKAQYVNTGSNLTALGVTSGTTYTTLSVAGAVPSTAVDIYVSIVSANTGAYMGVAPNTNYGSVTSITNPPPVGISGGVGSSYASGSFALESMNIYAQSANAGVGSVFVNGWNDNI